MKRKYIISALIIFTILALDQGLKIWVKTHMIENQNIPQHYDSWWNIHFVENPGMAFSIELPGPYGKLVLSVFRFFAIGFIFYMIVDLIRKNKPEGLVYCAAAIFAGAAGNLIDSAVYGLIFTDSYGRVAEMFPANGYAGFMQGYVVDMLWFPILRGEFPKWLPIWGGEPFEFFRPVFNIADAAITVSVFFVLIFQKRFFPQEETTNTSTSNEQPSKETTTDAVQPTPEA